MYEAVAKHSHLTFIKKNKLLWKVAQKYFGKKTSIMTSFKGRENWDGSTAAKYCRGHENSEFQKDFARILLFTWFLGQLKSCKNISSLFSV